jgi:hypothetical protein
MMKFKFLFGMLLLLCIALVNANIENKYHVHLTQEGYWLKDYRPIVVSDTVYIKRYIVHECSSSYYDNIFMVYTESIKEPCLRPTMMETMYCPIVRRC